MNTAKAESGIDQEPLPAVANQPQEPKPSRDAGVPAWLRSIAYDGDSRPQINAPHSLEFGGVVHTVATNGHRIIAVPHDYGCSPFEKSFATSVQIMLGDESGEAVTLDLVAFRSFVAGIVPVMETCEQCDGKGVLECDDCDGTGEGEQCECISCGDVHERDCKECDGEGFANCSACGGKNGDSIVFMRLNGKLFNARLFASPPELLSGDTATLRLRAHTKPTRIDGDGWHFLVMALRDEKPDAVAGEFSTEVAA